MEPYFTHEHKEEFPGVAVFNDNLYVFGGNDGTSFLHVVSGTTPSSTDGVNIALSVSPVLE